ncbi:MAG TPA: DUF3152 domain-containing protein [Actinophytocola sp.]|uniref:DUF3152 domain-containing protein n=1 Tax=Actinophytocola sp. TaxID=1872138 RepID=UPI002DDD93C9|nr:DUF3152 domain-containing protein [Actinophytocola sp.]HEV2781286.1 DUF3152 domain-containing protein [Actinophytocola sp.]
MSGRPQTGAQRETEPLRASWRPEQTRQPAGRRGGRKPRRGVARLVRTYGWRIYALPILLVLTVLVVLDTVGKDAVGARAAGNQSGPDAALAPEAQTDTSQPPDVTELPAEPVDVSIPTAELPNGGPYTEAAAGIWHVVPGAGARVGTGGKLYTYTVEVEDGIDPSSYGGDEAFAKLIDQTLLDPRGWTGDGKVSVQRVDGGTPDIRISLAAPQTVHRPDKCGFAIRYESSCFRRSESRVLINLARWVRGAVAFSGDILTYRQYAINHEIGHAFNNGHVGCAEEGALAPVMMQQTFGVANNFVAELNRAVRNRDPVEADGKTCKPNAWPNPLAKPGT